MKKVLIPGGKLSDWALVNAAHRLGMYVITSGTHRDAPAHKFSDEYIYADYSDPDAMLRIAKEAKIDYMCSCANDFGMLSTAYVCEKLGLPGHDSYQTTWDLHHKDTFKEMSRRLNLHSPVATVFSSMDDAMKYIHEKAGVKLIIKPVDNVASIGVSSPNTIEEARESVNHAFEKSKSKKIIIEPYVEGFFATVTSMIINQEVVAFFANSSYPYPQGEVIGPRFPANERNNGWSEPALYINDYKKDIIEDFNKIAREMKLVNGKLHCELLISPDHKATIFDVHRRMSGENQPWHEWNETTGLRWEDWIVRAECGLDLSDFPVGIQQSRFFHKRMLYAPKDGIIKEVIFDKYLTSRLFPRYPGDNYRLFNFFTSDHIHESLCEIKLEFDSQEEMEEIADPSNDRFYSHISFVYDK